MTERLLQFIWQFQYYNHSQLQTSEAQSLDIMIPGSYNTNQGPDFLNAKIKIDQTIWAGSIEIHINSSDWLLHNHSKDRNYNNVILHVVWNNDTDLDLPFATLVLQSRVSKLLLKKYAGLMQGNQFIPCANQFEQLSELNMHSWKESLLVERLQQKTRYIEQLLKQNNQHWEEAFWVMLARNFGTKVNSDAFEKMAKTIPVSILLKHKEQVIQLEALLMGQSGLLDLEFKEAYPILLQKEYRFLQKKYRLTKIHDPLFFLRMRPANFPTIRLAQLAMLISRSQHLFSRLREIKIFAEAQLLFSVTANDYWHYHYVFDETSAFKKKLIGRQMIDNLFVNTVVPFLYAYGYYHQDEKLKNKAIQWIEMIAAESNKISRGFESLGMLNKTAFDSQAMIQLKHEYCDQKRCLQCAIGNKILKDL